MLKTLLSFDLVFIKFSKVKEGDLFLSLPQSELCDDKFHSLKTWLNQFTSAVMHEVGGMWI